MVRGRWFALIVPFALAGCFGGGSGDDAAEGASLDLGGGPAEPTIAEAILDPTLPPRWNVGDAWAVTTYGGPEEEQGFLVVTAATADTYTIAGTSEQAAGFDAIYDVSYIGPIRASDLAGSQQGSAVLYYSWPLADGKTWTASWDGYQVALTASATASGFTIVGTVDGEDYVHYDYDPALKWWSHVEFVREGYGIRMERLQSNWTGEVLTAVAKEVYSSAAAAPVASPNSGAFTIDEGQTFGWVTLAGGGSHWARAFYLIDPSGAPYPTTSISNVESSAEPLFVQQQERIPATPGEWHVVSPALHDPEGGFLITVHQVAVSKVPVAAAPPA